MPRIAGIDKSGHAIGVLVDIGYDSVLPAGMLLCDGSAVSRINYASLFAKIGTTWGSGDGSTTFNLPDGRGKFKRGRDHSSGNDPDAASRTTNSTGGATGDAVGSIQADQLQGHGHQMPVTGNAGGGGFITVGNPQQSTQSTAGTMVNDGTNGTPRVGNETRPKNIYVNLAIAFI